MPTILLQEIIDLLNSWKEGLGTQLEQALESLSNLEDNTFINSFCSFELNKHDLGKRTLIGTA